MREQVQCALRLGRAALCGVPTGVGARLWGEHRGGEAAEEDDDEEDDIESYWRAVLV